MITAQAAEIRPVTYPARPINGGPLEAALPKPGRWCYEPKYNGWRALVHAPTGLMFNRYGQRLTIAGLFGPALNRLGSAVLRVEGTPVEWFDCEALARRHELGKGTLLVFDYIVAAGATPQRLEERKQYLIQAFAAHDYRLVTVRVPNRASGLSGELLVPLDLLTKITKGCQSEQSIRLIGSENETKIRYSVAGSYVDRVITHIPAQEWPEMKTISQEPILLDERFKLALREALECSSQDSSRYVLNGACLDVRDKDANYVVGTDGRHLYSANTFKFGLPETLIVPGKKFVAWPGFVGDGPWRLRMLPGVKPASTDKKEQDKGEPPWFQIESDRWSYLARAIDGEFPNWKQVIPANTKGWTRIDLQPSAVAMLLEAVPLLPGNEDADKPILLMAGNGLVLGSRSSPGVSFAWYRRAGH